MVIRNFEFLYQAEIWPFVKKIVRIILLFFNLYAFIMAGKIDSTQLQLETLTLEYKK